MRALCYLCKFKQVFRGSKSQPGSEFLKFPYLPHSFPPRFFSLKIPTYTRKLNEKYSGYPHTSYLDPTINILPHVLYLSVYVHALPAHLITVHIHTYSFSLLLNHLKASFIYSDTSPLNFS